VAWSGSPSAFGWAQHNAEYQAAYIVGADGHLYAYSSTGGTTWTIQDVTAASQTALPAGVQLVGAPSGYAFTAGSSSPMRQSVFVTGSDGHLYNYNWVQSTSTGAGLQGTWDLTDVSGGVVNGGPTIGVGGVTLLGSPSALYVPIASGAVFEVYVTGSDGHLYEYVFQSNGWKIEDASSQAGQPSGTLVAGAPSAFSAGSSGGTGSNAQTDDIYVVTSDGQLAIFAYQPSATLTWSFSEQVAPSGVSLVGSTASGFAYG
jgi:hypothetical protein